MTAAATRTMSAPTGNARPSALRRIRATLGWMPAQAAAVGGAATIWALVVYRVWDMSERVPFDYSGDTLFIDGLLQGMSEHGWWYSNSDLNVPFGQVLHDFPNSGETLQLAVLRLGSIVVPDPGLLLNLYFFGGFFVLGAITFLTFRARWVSRHRSPRSSDSCTPFCPITSFTTPGTCSARRTTRRHSRASCCSGHSTPSDRSSARPDGDGSVDRLARPRAARPASQGGAVVSRHRAHGDHDNRLHVSTPDPVRRDRRPRNA